MSVMHKPLAPAMWFFALVVSLAFAPSAFGASFQTSTDPANHGKLAVENVVSATDTVAQGVVPLSRLNILVFDTRTVTSHYDESVGEEYDVYSYTVKAREYLDAAVRPNVKVAIDENSDLDDWRESRLRYLTKGRDYVVRYLNNDKVGTASVIVTGVGKYSGSVKKAFKIGYPISKCSIAKIKPLIYKGKKLQPTLNVRYAGKALKRGTDYKVSYESNSKVGTAKATIVGKGKYVGKKSITFKIKKGSVKSARIAKVKTQMYTGKPIEPTPKVKLGGVTLKMGRDYIITYKKNTKVGNAKLTIRGMRNFRGSKTISFKIRKVSAKSKSSTAKVYVSNKGKTYHKHSCKKLKGIKNAITKKKAIAIGYKPCKVCKP